jgi:UDP-N-acetylglucosamine:LPS N-acetylglucosamine transferase
MENSMNSDGKSIGIARADRTVPDRDRARRKVMAVSSGGGHWIELLRLRPAFDAVDVTFVTTNPEYRSMVTGSNFCAVCEATRHQKFRMLWLTLQILWILLRERPSCIITTGAAPGYFAVRLGKLLGIRTLWVDSMANAEELSLSGQLASKYADKVLTQWSHLATPSIEHHGAVI